MAAPCTSVSLSLSLSRTSISRAEAQCALQCGAVLVAYADYGLECEVGCACRYRGIRRATNTPVAVKCIDRLDVDCDPQKVRQLEREMNIAIKLRHQNIVNLIDVKFEEDVVLMVSELVDGGPLYDRVAAGPIPEEEARYYFHQMCAGVEYCHGQSVIHRDLKLENVLVARIGALKIADFGVSKDTSVSSAPKTSVGTISYMAPEVTMVSKSGSGVVDYGQQADIWSLAVILYVLVCGKYPFGFDGPKRQGGLPTSRVYERIRSGTVEYPPELSPEVQEMIGGMLIVDPAQRWGFAQIRQCAWFCGGKFDAPVVAGEAGAGLGVPGGGDGDSGLAELLKASAEQTIVWPEPSLSRMNSGMSVASSLGGALSPPSLREGLGFDFNDASSDGDVVPASFGSDDGIFSPVGSMASDAPAIGGEPSSPSAARAIAGGSRRTRFDSMGSMSMDGCEVMVFQVDD